MMQPFNRLWYVLAVLIGMISTPVLSQQVETAADVLPGSTAAYLEITKPADLIDEIMAHPVLKFIQDHEQFKKLILSPQFSAAFVGKAVLEQRIGEPLLDSVKTSLGEGLYLALDSETEGVVVLIKSNDEAKLKRLAGSILDLVTAQATEDGQKVPFKRDTYRDAPWAKFDDFLIARYQSWFLISNKPALAKKIVDNMHDRNSAPLSRQDWFKSAAKKRTAADAWAAINLESIRRAQPAAELFSGKTDNPGIELIFGGVLDALKQAPLAVANLDLDTDLNLSISMPFDADWAHKSREFFFGKNFNGRGPATLQPKNLIASLTSYRDISAWWLSKEELFEENVIAQLAQADSQLSTIFSGMDFGQDVLGALEPGVQIVVADNQFDEKYVPDVRLPAFALVGTLKDPDKIQRKIKIAFQSVIGFANINLGMQGQPQLDLETETIDNAKVSTASYVYDDDTEKGLLLFNFAPTIAFRGDQVIISSTHDLAVELAKLSEKTDGHCESNTLLQLDAGRLRQILQQNRESLIAQNMIEKGHDRRTAENEIKALLAVVSFFEDGRLDFRVESQEMKLDLTIRTKN